MDFALIDNLMKEGDIDGAINTARDYVSKGIPTARALVNLLELFTKNAKNATVNLQENKIKVMLTCHWTDSKTICKLWHKMSEDGNGVWGDLQIVDSLPADFQVIVNSPLEMQFLPDDRVILFRMEPKMEENGGIWKAWADPDPDRTRFLFSGYHKNQLNNLEWHLRATFGELMNSSPEKTATDSRISTVLSSKFTDPGHKLRVQFAKFIERRFQEDARGDDAGAAGIDVFGSNVFSWKKYMGSLPSHEKDAALLPYKYTFNAENHSIDNYCTEKIVDGILSECLTFYWGCPNLETHIDPRAFVRLELVDFEKDYQLILRAVKEDWWSDRIQIIREEKRRILTQLQFFPRVAAIIESARARV
jgi:hypothetical protein